MWTYVIIVIVLWVAVGAYYTYNLYRGTGGDPLLFDSVVNVAIMVIAMPAVHLWGKIYSLFVRLRDEESFESIKPANPAPHQRR